MGNAGTGEDFVVEGTISCAKNLRAGGIIAGNDHIRAGHGIEAGASIRCGRHLEAGWGIRAGATILADGAIRSGESILAGGEISGGGGYGIFAGLSVPKDAWERCAKVQASVPPCSLMSGWWEEAARAAV